MFSDSLSAYKGQTGWTLASMINWNSRWWFTWSTDSTLHTSFFIFLWKLHLNMLSGHGGSAMIHRGVCSEAALNAELRCENKRAPTLPVCSLWHVWSGFPFGKTWWLLLSQAAERFHRSVIVRRWVTVKDLEWAAQISSWEQCRGRPVADYLLSLWG